MPMPPDVALRRVAILFWITGASAAGHIVVVFLTQGRFALDLSLLGLWIARGLSNRERRAWHYAHICSFLTLVVTVLVVLAIAVRWISLSEIEFFPFGVPIRGSSNGAGLAFCGVNLAISGWQLWILQRSEVRDIFSSSADVDLPPAVTY